MRLLVGVLAAAAFAGVGAVLALGEGGVVRSGPCGFECELVDGRVYRCRLWRGHAGRHRVSGVRS